MHSFHHNPTLVHITVNILFYIDNSHCRCSCAHNMADHFNRNFANAQSLAAYLHYLQKHGLLATSNRSVNDPINRPYSLSKGGQAFAKQDATPLH